MKEERPPDKGIFVYALPRDRHNPRGRYNPYDLQVVSAQEARELPMYFTASATSVTLVSICIVQVELVNAMNHIYFKLRECT